LYRSDKLKINLTYLQKPVLLFVLYSIITTLIGLANSKPLMVIAREFFHVFYYLFAIVIYKYFNSKDYSRAFTFLLLLSIIISFEYVYVNLFTTVNRFVTFQSGLLPIASTILFSAILFNIKRSITSVLLIIIVLGTFVTLTRTLWITTFISFGAALLLFLYYEKKTKIITIIILVFIMLVPLFFITKYNKSNQASSTEQNVQDRTQSLAKPTEDHSFLMRAEIGLYVVRRFITSPIIGKGFGDYVRYRILGDTKANVIYPDSTYLYILWKSGIIGFIIYLTIFWRFLKITFTNYKNSDSIKTKIISLGLLSAFLGLAFLNVLSPLFIKYKSNIIIAFFLAYSDFQYNSNNRNKTI
jgi:O-antigen ligase